MEKIDPHHHSHLGRGLNVVKRHAKHPLLESQVPKPVSCDSLMQACFPAG
jgi:hypothetical protein